MSEQTGVGLYMVGLLQSQLESKDLWQLVPGENRYDWHKQMDLTEKSKRMVFRNSDEGYCKQCVYLIGLKGLDSEGVINLRYP